MKIGVIDSGLGGFSILDRLITKLPFLDYYYLADQQHCPYSEKSPVKLQQLAAQQVEFLLNQGCELIVLACNTLSVTSLAFLREKFKVPFIGTVPAVKLASEKLPQGSRVLVLATVNTTNSDYLRQLIKPLQSRTKFILLGSTVLVEYIEAWQPSKTQAECERLIQQLPHKIEAVVFGCTHFPFIKMQLSHALSYSVWYFDSGAGVAKRLKSLLPDGLDQSSQGQQQFFSTDSRVSAAGLAAKFAFLRQKL
ncbi:MAG: glutamate racemase [Candidatus Pacebacteria bacterium]|nr:glutamate racemase [Candidatus Paceibacterota bacterium]